MQKHKTEKNTKTKRTMQTGRDKQLQLWLASGGLKAAVWNQMRKQTHINSETENIK